MLLHLDGEPIGAFDIDPFSLVSDELMPFSDNIKELSRASTRCSRPPRSTEKRHGKRFRPTIVMLPGSVPMIHVQLLETSSLQAQLGQITEMIHGGPLIHDDVLDDADMRRGGDSIHKMFSNKVAVLAGDYLLARASVLLAKLRNVEVVQVMATASILS